MFSSKIVEIGSLVEEFKQENLLVLFGNDAPPELADISVLHVPEEDNGHKLVEGSTLSIGNNEYHIVQVGSEANENFDTLGHVSIYFSDDENTEILPGAILVTPSHFPELALNEKIKLY